MMETGNLTIWGHGKTFHPMCLEGHLISYVISVWEMTQEPSGRTQLSWTTPKSCCQYHAKLLPVPGESANDNLWNYFLQICALIVRLCYWKDEGNTVLSQHYFVPAWSLLSLPPSTVTFTVLMPLGLSTWLWLGGIMSERYRQTL